MNFFQLKITCRSGDCDVHDKQWLVWSKKFSKTTTRSIERRPSFQERRIIKEHFNNWVNNSKLMKQRVENRRRDARKWEKVLNQFKKYIFLHKHFLF